MYESLSVHETPSAIEIRDAETCVAIIPFSLIGKKKDAIACARERAKMMAAAADLVETCQQCLNVLNLYKMRSKQDKLLFRALKDMRATLRDSIALAVES